MIENLAKSAFGWVYKYKGNATLKLQSEEPYKPWILIQIWSKSMETEEN